MISIAFLSEIKLDQRAEKLPETFSNEAIKEK